MKITIISVGKFDNSSLEDLFLEYQKRLKNKIILKEINYKSSNSMNEDRIKKIEGELILKNLNPNSIRIFLDENGKLFSSIELANMIKKYSIQGDVDLCFIIGGAFGLDKSIIGNNDIIFSLSRLTYTHLMARVILIEQIYRSFLINSNHPYHK